MPHESTERRPLGRRRAARTVLTAALVASVWSTSATSADAASTWRSDPTGDVVVGPNLDDGPVKVRDVPYADVVGVGIDYETTSLRIATSMRSYRTRGGYWLAKLRTSQGYDYQLGISFDPEQSDDPRLFRRSSKRTSGFYTYRCDGITVARTARGITARVPTTCLGNAWKVRVGITTLQYPCFESDPCDDDRDYSDDAMSDGRQTTSTALTLGPWVEQG